MDYSKRYLKNKKLISQKEQEVLKSKKVLVLGCGGLGGYIIEMLARLGVGNLRVVDFDVFDESNLNRQILSDEKNLGLLKVDEALKRVKTINSDIKTERFNLKIDGENIEKLLTDIDLVVDALDSIPLKIMVEEKCSRLGITMVHGAIGGWVAQVAVIRPGDFILKKMYNGIEKGIEAELGNPSFTPAMAASIQVSESIKILLNKGESLENQVLYIDLQNNTFSTFEA
ncbi:HesA/MoeB/ThiF family protein [uncultured Ilyobacter sp.]|uniref:HesA/MoeB/ThiF family protein n=1 Tax=uncultured Ilyobacter sp. TaxID=544433 RepID=UPI0029C049A6|nr:HesA/MoeB/ThiF family protein [uncultured Ilyobacter sp.]